MKSKMDKYNHVPGHSYYPMENAAKGRPVRACGNCSV